MIASILSLDRRRVNVARLADPYAIHKIVYDLFPGNQRDFLYFDRGMDREGKRILILSSRQPLVPVSGDIKSKFVPESFLGHRRYAFQILLNPVYRQAGNKSFIPVTSRDDLRQWFLRKQEDWGFMIDGDALDIFDTGVIEIRKNGIVVPFNKAQFRGILTVTDSDRFKTVFTSGIGRGKSFGFGLLQLHPASD